jgi:hypothetical protein
MIHCRNKTGNDNSASNTEHQNVGANRSDDGDPSILTLISRQ